MKQHIITELNGVDMVGQKDKWDCSQLKETWKKSKKEQNVKMEKSHDCGRPGINGGYFDNPNLKLGVNCWGVKRKAFKEEDD